MIEPSGSSVSLPPNRQSKVGAYAAGGAPQGQKGQKSNVADRAQDDPGFGSLSTAGIGDDIPSSERVYVRQAQDAGSKQGAFVTEATGLGDINKGTENFEGHVAIADDLRAGTPTEDQVRPAPRLKFNDQQSLNKNPWLMD